jgi:phosphate starvation-inducible PhoH-like protein
LQETIQLQNADEERALLGRQDRTLRLLREALGVRIMARKGLVTLDGEAPAVREGVRVVGELLAQVREKGDLSDDEVEGLLYAIRGGRAEGNGNGGAQLPGMSPGNTPGPSDRVAKALDDSPVRPKTPGQARYVDAVMRHDVVFSIGPAGTGKTYLAVALAVRMMRQGLFRRLVLARPAVEAGERLGFLPGDLNAKVSPYLRPLYDAIGDFIDFGDVRRYMERDVIEVAPLAYMRGRTLDHAFIILDEGQNTTRAQMQMFLTRMGRRSKIVVTGDVTQIDLPRGVQSGLVDARRRLQDIPGIGIVELDRADIVRHPLVQKIVDAYGEGEPRGVEGENQG